MNSHVFALNRKPKHPNATLSKYYVGDADCVALCEPMLMIYDAAGDTFSDPQTYNPNRYLTPIDEPKTPQKVMTWGAGVHLCPGREFAKYEIRLALAMITTRFEKIELSKGPLPEPEYFSPSAFSGRDLSIKLKPLENDAISETTALATGNRLHYLALGQRKYAVQYLSEGGWLIRDCLNRDEQRSFYNYTVELSENSDEQKMLEEGTPDDKPGPLTYYNLVYTGGSNCKKPDRWFEFGETIWKLLGDNAETLEFPESKSQDGSIRQHGFDSIYAQLYGASSRLNSHKDQYVTWGVSVSIGASCELQFGDQSLLLHSGDALVADFSKVQHAVNKVLPETAPGWFNADFDAFLTEEDGKKAKNFGRCRCSVQIRKVKDCMPERMMEIDEFRQLINGKPKTHG